MRGPRPTAVILSEAQREGLEALVRRHSSPQQAALRARIVLAAAEGLNNSQVARRLDVSIPTARTWRQRWLGLQAVPEDDLDLDDRLADAPRRGRPPRITAEQVCRVVALACETRPPPGGRSPAGPAARSPTRSVSEASSTASRPATRGGSQRQRDLRPHPVRQWPTPRRDEGFDAAASAMYAPYLEAPELARKGASSAPTS